jgi:phosphatidylinositol-3-phosphatase
VPKVLASPQYRAGTLALFVAWDENDGPVHAAGNHVPLIVVGPSVVAGTRLTAPANHYTLLATWEDLLGLPRLARARTAADLWP